MCDIWQSNWDQYKRGAISFVATDIIEAMEQEYLRIKLRRLSLNLQMWLRRHMISVILMLKDFDF